MNQTTASGDAAEMSNQTRTQIASGERTSSAPSRTSRRTVKRAPVVLIENTRVVTEDCRWCDATAGLGVHSRACPCGERYAQVQQLGASGYQFSSGERSND